MAVKPYNKRPYDVFVSYSHREGEFVESLVTWLQNIAGLRTWWDTARLAAGDPLVHALPAAIESSRAAIFCVSSAWIESTWCEQEFGAALQQQRHDRRYRIIAVKLDNSPTPAFLANARYVEMSALTPTSAAVLLTALVPEPAPWPHSSQDVYMSCSWQANDARLADTIGNALSNSFGFRMIGDSTDHPIFDGKERIRQIIGSCGALVAVLPFRDDQVNSFTSKWILREVMTANDIGRPFMLFADRRVKLDGEIVRASIGSSVFEVPEEASDPSLLRSLSLLEDEFCSPELSTFSFFATSISKDQAGTERIVDLMEQITSMECLIGQRMRSQHAQQEIVERIRGAQFVVADITASNVNSIIEAGIARGSGTPLHLISEYPATGDLRTRFMFRDMEVNWYRDEVERLGVVHRISRQYRRRTYNPGL